MGYSPWSHKESDTTERLHFTPNTDLGYFEINHIALKNCISFTCDFPACSRKVKEERGKTYELKCVIHHGKG